MLGRQGQEIEGERERERERERECAKEIDDMTGGGGTKPKILQNDQMFLKLRCFSTLYFLQK
jgi:hypothetical protein